jgi:glycosyltransferase involved in cell wall biosynthesis
MRLLWPGQARKMQRFEADTLRRFDRVIAVSKRDARALQERFALPRVDPVDTGVDLVFFQSTPRPALPARDAGTIVFTGVMDSPANIEGIRFLLDRVWPAIVAVRPAARLLVVGRNPPESLVRAAPTGVRFTGTVDDIRPHVAAAHLAVIPLNVGSGTRIKAFEAMAMGRPVVSTTVGVEGLDVVPGEHLLVADDPAGFVAAILRLLDDPRLGDTLAGNARALIEEKFSWAHVARQFEAVCLDALAARPNLRRPE